MKELIERLEKATGPDRTLDCRIHAAHIGGEFVVVGRPTYIPERYFANPNPEINWIGYDLLNVSPAYTSSIDAALTLVPNDLPAMAQRSIAPDPHCALIGRPSKLPGKPSVWRGNGATPAIALCIAALKARATE